MISRLAPRAAGRTSWAVFSREEIKLVFQLCKIMPRPYELHGRTSQAGRKYNECQSNDMNESLNDQLTNCECCPRNCRVNRLEGQVGFCRVCCRDSDLPYRSPFWGRTSHLRDKRFRDHFFRRMQSALCLLPELPDQPGVSAGHTRTLTTDELASEMLRLQDEGAHNINFVSPSHMIFQMAEAIQAGEGQGTCHSRCVQLQRL